MPPSLPPGPAPDEVAAAAELVATEAVRAMQRAIERLQGEIAEVLGVPPEAVGIALWLWADRLVREQAYAIGRARVDAFIAAKGGLRTLCRASNLTRTGVKSAFGRETLRKREREADEAEEAAEQTWELAGDVRPEDLLLERRPARRPRQLR